MDVSKDASSCKNLESSSTASYSDISTDSSWSVSRSCDTIDLMFAANNYSKEKSPSFLGLEDIKESKRNVSSFEIFRLQYLVVFAAIMLADGLQGEFRH